jgi:hypothetical protein
VSKAAILAYFGQFGVFLRVLFGPFSGLVGFRLVYAYVLNWSEKGVILGVKKHPHFGVKWAILAT